MIIELPLLQGRSGGQRYRMGYYHFPNNNLAIRRRCAAEVGGYDPKALKSEDVDICFRVARSPQWVACREAGAVVRHKARADLLGLVRQMWGWGILLARPYRETGNRGFYAYWIRAKTATVGREIEIDGLPGLVCLFLTDFHIAHALGLVALMTVSFGAPLVASIAALAGAGFFWRFLREARRVDLPFWKRVQLAGVHYVANVSFMTAAFVGGLRLGVIFLPATIFPPRSTSQH